MSMMSSTSAIGLFGYAALCFVMLSCVSSVSHNKFHSVNIFINDEPSFVPEIHERPGVPDPSRQGGEQYASEISSTFALSNDRVRTFLQSRPAGTAIATVPWLNIPLQFVLSENAVRIYPITVTLTRPKPDRSIRKVLIWWANTFIGARSINWVSDAFANSGIQSVAVQLGEGSLRDFSAKYADPSFDVVWLIGHGDWNTEYHRSRFSVTENDQPDLEWWATLPRPAGDRRLLVLDLCDSGTVAITGGLLDLGLPPLLASPSQAIVGNLWPVDQLASAIYGTLLALKLAENGTFFGAYADVSQMLKKGIDSCREYISQQLGASHESISAMNATELDFGALANCGASAFFE